MYSSKIKKKDPEEEKFQWIAKYSLQTLRHGQQNIFNMKLNFNLNFTPSQQDKYWENYLSEVGLTQELSRKSGWEEPLRMDDLEEWPSHNSTGS